MDKNQVGHRERLWQGRPFMWHALQWTWLLQHVTHGVGSGGRSGYQLQVTSVAVVLQCTCRMVLCGADAVVLSLSTVCRAALLLRLMVSTGIDHPAAQPRWTGTLMTGTQEGRWMVFQHIQQQTAYRSGAVYSVPRIFTGVPSTNKFCTPCLRHMALLPFSTVG